MSDIKKTKIQQIVNYFESGDKYGDYGCISLYEDGPNGARQITYGKSQTTESGNLQDLVKMYIENEGIVSCSGSPCSHSGRNIPNGLFVQLI
jgi:chitosanase